MSKNGSSLEDRVKELEGKNAGLEVEINYFLRPLLIRAYNELFKDSRSEHVTPPAVILWLRNEFQFEKNKVKKQYLAGLFEQLKQVFPIDLFSMDDLKIDPGPDLSNIFDR